MSVGGDLKNALLGASNSGMVGGSFTAFGKSGSFSQSGGRSILRASTSFGGDRVHRQSQSVSLEGSHRTLPMVAPGSAGPSIEPPPALQQRQQPRFSLSKIPESKLAMGASVGGKDKAPVNSKNLGRLPSSGARVGSRRESVASSLKSRPILTKEHRSSFMAKTRKTVEDAWLKDTQNAPSEAILKEQRRHVQDSRVFQTKETESSNRMLKTLLPPTLHHVAPDSRGALPEDFKTLRRYDYDRLVKQNFSSLQSHAAGGPNWRANVKPSESVGNHRVKKNLPILDFSYCDIREAKQLSTVVPRGGKTLKAFGRDTGAYNNPSRKPNKATKLFQGKEFTNNVVVIRSGDEAYAFDQDEEGHGDEPGKMSKFDRMFMDFDEVPAEEEISRNRYEAQHCRLSNNNLTQIGTELRLTLSQMLLTQLVVLDLSFNELRTIGSDFLVDPRDETNKDEHGVPLPTKEAIYEHASTAPTAEQATGKMKKERITGKVISRYLRRPAMTSEGCGASLIFAVLTTLYLHGNKLQSAEELFRLAPLSPSLTHLTAHGNDAIDQQLHAKPWLKRELVELFPHMVSFNFTTLSAEFYD